MFSLCRYCSLVRNSFRGKFCVSLPFATTVTESPPAKTSFIYDYLRESWGFSASEAMAASIRCSQNGYNIKTPKKAEFVLNFLKQSGFSEAHVRSLISRNPRYLIFNVDKTLKPKVEVLRQLGFSGSELADLVVRNPKILAHNAESHIIPTISFLRTLFHTDENVVRAIKNHTWLLSLNFKETLTANVEILRQTGVPDSQISWLMLRDPHIFTLSSDRLKQLIARVQETGISWSSGKIFLLAIVAFRYLSKDALKVKFDVLKSFGWSEEDILSGFCKTPLFLTYTESKMREKMGFFLNELGYQASDIARRPRLLTFSLEKRLIPRHEVLKILKSRGLLKGKRDVLTIMGFSEHQFLQDYILQYIDKAPEIEQAYTACMDQRGERRKMGKES